MKQYALATVLVEVPEEEYRIWSESADLTFHLGRILHNPDDGVWLVDYNDLIEMSPEALKAAQTRCFDEHGGV